MTGAGNDSITLGNATNTGADTVNTGTGNDTITTGQGNDVINSSDGNDSINSGGGNDTINGGAGDDTIHGGTGTDVLTGGGGGDLFTFNAGDSPATAPSTAGNGFGATGIDQIRDWTGGTAAAPTNFLEFLNAAGTTAFAHGTALNFSETTATDFTSAVAQANAHLGTGIYVAVQVGSDVVVFADTNVDHSITAADDAVTLVGKSLTDINFSNIVGS